MFLPVDFPVYEEASARVMETLRAMPGAVVEVLGWDEAFVGLETDDPLAAAHAIQAAVLEATSLHCSVGIGDTLVRAKIATDFGKPQGTFRLTRDNWMEVMGARPTTALWGVGNRIGARLEAIGIRTVADLAAADEDALVAAFGPASGGHLGRSRRRSGVARRHPVGRPRARPGDDLPGRHRRGRRRPRRAGRARDTGRSTARIATAVQRVHPQGPFAPFFTFTKVRKLTEPTATSR